MAFLPLLPQGIHETVRHGMEYDFDIIVIGGGAGGGTLAAACAASGKRVLLVERGVSAMTGDRTLSSQKLHNEKATLLDKKPYDDRCIELNNIPTRLYMGGVVGGGTSVFGGALLGQRQVLSES